MGQKVAAVGGGSGFFLILIPRKSRKGTIPAPVDWNGKIAMTQQRNRKRSLAVAVVLILFNMKYSVVLMMKETFYIMNVVMQILTFYFVMHGIRSTVVRYMVCIHNVVSLVMRTMESILVTRRTHQQREQALQNSTFWSVLRCTNQPT